ncbi:MAG: hypothetical protein CVV50_00075 [Spirochaetae bacterium HGW-Spirochaetae-6]|nr:MAG: hypothetical protein CVV50_00075 [Spirochaetae bacterium HGW-Spirochaetae-6]
MDLITRLKNLRETDELEFKYQLRNLLKKSMTENLDAFRSVVNDFKREVIYDSFFFIDIINEALLYFFYKNEGNPRVIKTIMSLIHVIAPVGDKDTLELIGTILKRIPTHSADYPVLMNYFGEIEHKISFLEQKISKLKLYPQKPMLMEWYD